MILTFVHACGESCPINDREVPAGGDFPGSSNAFVVPDLRCNFTYKKLQLVAIDGDRDI